MLMSNLFLGKIKLCKNILQHVYTLAINIVGEIEISYTFVSIVYLFIVMLTPLTMMTGKR